MGTGKLLVVELFSHLHTCYTSFCVPICPIPAARGDALFPSLVFLLFQEYVQRSFPCKLIYSNSLRRNYLGKQKLSTDLGP